MQKKMISRERNLLNKHRRQEVLKHEIVVVNDEKMGIFMIEKIANNPSRLNLKRVDEIVETFQAEANRASTHRIRSVLAVVNIVILIAISTRTRARNGQIWQISEIAAHRDRIGVDAKLQLASIGCLECHKLA